MIYAQSVLFDVGNTLAHLDYAYLARSLAELGGPEVTEEGLGRADALMRLSGLLGSTRSEDPAGAAGSDSVDPQRRFFRRYMEGVAQHLDGAEGFGARLGDLAFEEHRRYPTGLWRIPDPEGEMVLETLSAHGIRVGAISNADGRVRAQLALLGFLRWLDPVIDSTEAGVTKPNPEIFALALRQMSVPARRAVYVGDMLDVDVAGARAAGMQAVLYDRFGVMPEGAEGYVRIRCLGELVSEVLEGLSRAGSEA